MKFTQFQVSAGDPNSGVPYVIFSFAYHRRVQSEDWGSPHVSAGSLYKRRIPLFKRAESWNICSARCL